MTDELLLRARAEKLNVSALASAALEEELDRRAKIAALDAYLAELEREEGPISTDEAAAAREWVDSVVSTVPLGAAGMDRTTTGQVRRSA
jgi:post-segregation antitoxin (ccd killing protein)